MLFEDDGQPTMRKRKRVLSSFKTRVTREEVIVDEGEKR